MALTCAPAAAMACSPAPVSLLERMTSATSVFVARMEAQRADGSFDMRVEESFKGNVAGRTVPVRLPIGTQCGFDKPKGGDRFLLFVRGDEPVTTAGGSFLIWSEAGAAALNPVEATLATLRRLLANDRSRPPTPLVPNAEAAVHRALEVLIPVFGAEGLAQRKPLVAVELDRKGSDDAMWRVTAGTLTVDVGKWSASAKVSPRATLP